MLIEISEFELAVVLCWLGASVTLILGMFVFFQVQHRRSPVGRIAPRRWFGV
jgi:hypothetical protein